MYKGTTPTIRWHIKNEDLNFDDITEIWMTFKDSANYTVNKVLTDLILNKDNRTIEYEFTQEETLKFKIGIIETPNENFVRWRSGFCNTNKRIYNEQNLKRGNY